MRKQLLVLCPLLLFATAVWGTPIQMCTNNTLQYYITNYSGGCTLGSLTFSDFTFSSGGTVQPQTSASGVDVTTVTGSDTGLSFNGPFGVTAGLSLDDLIGFLVTSTTPSITNETLSMQGYAATGGGNVQVAESLCIGGVYANNGTCPSPATTQSLDVFANSTTQVQSVTANFAATNTLDVVKNIIVQGGPAGSNSSAGVSVVVNTTTSGGAGGQGGGPVPEPDTLLSLGSGLVITSLLFRRKLRRGIA